MEYTRLSMQRRPWPQLFDRMGSESDVNIKQRATQGKPACGIVAAFAIGIRSVYIAPAVHGWKTINGVMVIVATVVLPSVIVPFILMALFDMTGDAKFVLAITSRSAVSVAAPGVVIITVVIIVVIFIMIVTVILGVLFSMAVTAVGHGRRDCQQQDQRSNDHRSDGLDGI